MDAAGPSSKRAGLPARAAAMLRRPHAAWAEVEADPATPAELWTGYIAPLALIGPLCEGIGLAVFGASIANIPLKAPLAETAVGAVVDYGLALASVWLLAEVISLLSPLFGGTADRLRALKLVAFSGTAIWVAGVFALYPVLGFPVAMLGGLYSLYTLNLGLPRMMRAPQDRALTFFAVILIAAVVLALALRWASGFLR